MFTIFAWACRKYGFSFSMTTHGQINIMLRPNDAFENIYVNQSSYNYNLSKLFLKAIKEMKLYRKRESQNGLS